MRERSDIGSISVKLILKVIFFLIKINSKLMTI